jgi:hypothetical protein
MAPKNRFSRGAGTARDGIKKAVLRPLREEIPVEPVATTGLIL